VSRPFEELLSAAKEGEAWAWEEIFKALAPAVTGYVAIRGAREPGDVAAETFYHVARAIKRFTGSEESFRSWVFVIAHRKLIDARRAANRQVEQGALTGDHTDRSADPESIVLDRIALEDMQSLIALLTDDQQQVIALRLIADLSLAETAEVMGKNVGSIKSLQRRAIEQLRRSFEGREVSR